MRGGVFAVCVILSTTVARGEPVYGVSSDASPESTAFAFAHLALVLGMCVVVTAFAWVLYRRAKLPNAEREFLEEMGEDENGSWEDSSRHPASRSSRANQSNEHEEPLEPWERPADWWQK